MKTTTETALAISPDNRQFIEVLGMRSSSQSYPALEFLTHVVPETGKCGLAPIWRQAVAKLGAIFDPRQLLQQLGGGIKPGQTLLSSTLKGAR